MKQILVSALVLFVALLPAAPASACAPATGFGNTVELLDDVNFDQLCASWYTYGSASVAGGSYGDYYVQFDASEEGEVLEQTVSVPSNDATNELDLGLDVVNAPNGVGSEGVVVEIVHGSTTDTIDTINAASGSGLHQYSISNYAGQTITVRLSVIQRSHPVTATVFRAQTIEVWATQS